MSGLIVLSQNSPHQAGHEPSKTRLSAPVHLEPTRHNDAFGLLPDFGGRFDGCSTPHGLPVTTRPSFAIPAGSDKIERLCCSVFLKPFMD